MRICRERETGKQREILRLRDKERETTQNYRPTETEN